MQGDAAIGSPYRDRDAVLTAHHNAFDDRLPAVLRDLPFTRGLHHLDCVAFQYPLISMRSRASHLQPELHQR
jgi:hypothetical protein